MMDNKKICAICGEELSRYGNRKLADGMVCRNCVKNASEWLDESDYLRRNIEDFRKHLAYREANKERLKTFKAVKQVEGKYSLYLDDKQQEFVFSRRKDFKKNNDDVARFKEISEINIFEERYLDTDSVDICFNVRLNNPEIDNIYFRVNEFPGLERDSKEYKEALDLAFKYLKAFEDEDSLAFEQTEGEVYNG